MYKFRSPIFVMLLSIFTCGIYYIYWVWVTSRDINYALGKEIVSPGIVVLSYFCGFVAWYVWYKWDKGLVELGDRTGIRYANNFILWIVLSVLAGVGSLVMMFQVQDTLNETWQKIYELNKDSGDKPIQ